MKKWIAPLVVAVVVVALTALRFFAPAAAGSAHHELVERLDSKGNKVEVFWDAPPSPGKKLPAIVYVHGMQDPAGPGAINLVRADVLRDTAKRGYFAAAMSMPGYGQSSGERDFCGRGTQAALQSTIAYLRKRKDVDADHIAISGASCGAVAASMIADKEPVAAMILVSGTFDLEDMYAKWRTPAWQLPPETLDYMDKSITADGDLKTAAKYRSALPNAGRFMMPVLIIAGGRDRVVDTKQSQALADALEESGRTHTYIFNPDGEHMIPAAEWVKYSTSFLHDTMGK